MPSWTQGFIRSIKPVNPQKKNIEKGDKLNVKLEGASFSPVVLVRLIPRLTDKYKLIINRKTRPKYSNGEAAFRFCSMATTHFDLNRERLLAQRHSINQKSLPAS